MEARNAGGDSGHVLSRTVMEPFESPPDSFDGLAEAVAAGRTAMWCEAPLLDGKARAVGYLDIRGWAYSRAGIERIDVHLGDLRYRAKLGKPRPDLRALFSDDVTNSGFELTIELAEEQAGRLQLAVVARAADGNDVGMRGDVECRPSMGTTAPATTAVDATSRTDVPEAAAAGAVERFVPEDVPGTLLEAEHETRYRWAAQAIAGRTVLDAGCGAGYGAAILSQAGAARTVGVDISEDVIADAKESHGEVAEFAPGDLHDLPFEDDAFDAVACFEAIEHVEDPELALDELRRVMRSDGVLFISTPNRRVYPPGNPFHVHEYLPEELEETLSRRFAYVALYRQQSHGASLICDDDAFAKPSPDRDLHAHVRRLAEGEPGHELYTLALASDVRLPEMTALALLGGAFDERRWHDLSWALEERVMISQQNAVASDAEADAARQAHERTLELLQRGEQERRDAEQMLEALKRSLSWRITQPLRWGKRAARR